MKQCELKNSPPNMFYLNLNLYTLDIKSLIRGEISYVGNSKLIYKIYLKFRYNLRDNPNYNNLFESLTIRTHNTAYQHFIENIIKGKIHQRLKTSL